MKKNYRLSNTFWFYQHRVKYAPFLCYSQLKSQNFKWNTLYTFCIAVLLTGGRFLGRNEKSIPGCLENGRLQNASIKTEILGCNQTFEPHPEIWGHSLALTNDYRILFCGGIQTIKEDQMNPWPYSWGDRQGKFLVNRKIYLSLSVS